VNDKNSRFETWHGSSEWQDDARLASLWEIWAAACYQFEIDPLGKLGQWIDGKQHINLARFPNEATGDIGGIPSTFRDVAFNAVRLIQAARLARDSAELTFQYGSRVKPVDWLRWTGSKGIKTPQALADLTAEGPPQNEPSRAELLATNARQLKEINSLKSRLADIDDELEGGGLKFVAYFAREYGYDPDASKNDATSKVMKALETCGLPMTRKSVIKWLKRAINKYPEDPSEKRTRNSR
jgi:hypothetical protein